ncbi:PHO85 cyclin-7 [Smittium culicis]|uniref:PHO85 cyclin-7 n=1 Tax=Smittium culicis TaxID=133412 RepID=A0A1R1YS29_9FUNG|nr:PHO85 cyclin-7 [Smittium culicis]OMJ29681.1 PHO85 cyclin-7 [Smittium culicis]
MDNSLNDNVDRLAKYLEYQIKKNSLIFNQEKEHLYAKINDKTQQLRLIAHDPVHTNQAGQISANNIDSEKQQIDRQNREDMDYYHKNQSQTNDENTPVHNSENATNGLNNTEFKPITLKKSKFYSREVPEIGIAEYLKRIFKYCPFGNYEILCLLVYFERIRKSYEDPSIEKLQNRRLCNSTLVSFNNIVEINAYSVHRLLITLVCVTCKFQSDTFFTNTRYAKVGGLSVKEMNSLELSLLLMIDFNLYVEKNELLSASELINLFS